MSDSNTNPFVLPGMGQDSDLSGNPLLASMEMMRQAWAGLAGPGGLAQSLPMTPPLNVEELERRITELRAVEGWLRLNLQMLSSTIQGMEVQRATIATLRSFVGSVSSMDTGAPRSSSDPSPLEVALGLKPAPGQPAGASAFGQSPFGQTPPPDATAEPSVDAPADAPAADAGADALNLAAAQATQASQAWWGLLQQQFNNIAAATAATLPQMMGGEAGDAQGAPSAQDAAQGASQPPAKSAAKTGAKAGAKSAAKTQSKAPAKKAAKSASKTPGAARKPDAKPAARGVAKTSIKPARRST
ncbi:PhaM family polyhydroxyalkanoate granule multifunctional regulatory protein [Pseudomonadota bacterium AL_CKDN230030165-1A_HGKHYDSX7]